ncbi:CoA transferase [Candidimonas humi]|uniref:CaiB/BaiF CoA transferase family protein n=1 Tax=Candidimonas humi TaxID=683355 RepID=A0ABV8NY44_9BURK|nr:CaiB/BaiF CoA-transferase family protein [Candidimonas humi]MBV6305704.1 CoA transferase [Candidimonas humi]
MKDFPPVAFDESAKGPLAGVRVLDLSRLVAGNVMTLQLADFGADVIKVEPPGGDTLRNFRSDGYDTWWNTYCRNKRSVGLDFRHPEAIPLLKKMLPTVDVFVESFRSGTLENMGLAPEVIHAINPNIVITRITGWGQTGPYRTKPGFGTLVEGYTGFAAINGFDDREPVLPPIFLGDMVSGLYGFGATMTALWNMRVNGKGGEIIDLSLFEPTVSVLGPQAAAFELTGKLKARTGSRSNTTAPRNVYKTADGKWICISTSTETMAKRFFNLIGRSDIPENPEYSTARGRLRHVEYIDGLVAQWFAKQNFSEALALFDREGVTAGPVYDASDLVEDDYVREREVFVRLPEDQNSQLVHNITPRFARDPGGFRYRAPHIGEHNEEILAPIVGRDAFKALQARNVVCTNKER